MLLARQLFIEFIDGANGRNHKRRQPRQPLVGLATLLASVSSKPLTFEVSAISMNDVQANANQKTTTSLTVQSYANYACSEYMSLEGKTGGRLNSLQKFPRYLI